MHLILEEFYPIFLNIWGLVLTDSVHAWCNWWGTLALGGLAEWLCRLVDEDAGLVTRRAAVVASAWHLAAGWD